MLERHNHPYSREPEEHAIRMSRGIGRDTTTDVMGLSETLLVMLPEPGGRRVDFSLHAHLGR